MPDPDEPRCADSCGRVATDERLVSVGTDADGGLIETVELVCVNCARKEAA